MGKAFDDLMLIGAGVFCGILLGIWFTICFIAPGV